MPLHAEIEHKWICDGLPSLPWDAVRTLRQGYLWEGPYGIRLREQIEGGVRHCFCTHKTGRGLIRQEQEEPLPPAVFDLLWPLAGARFVEKIRYCYRDGQGLVWEADEYTGRHAGVYVLEVELDAPDTPFTIPRAFTPHILREVTEEGTWVAGNLARLNTPPPLPPRFSVPTP